MKLVVLGGGPAGINAAVRARQMGAEVTLIERKRLGGTSLNEGAAPVRTLARAARLLRDAQSWPTFGLTGAAPTVDIVATLANVKRVANYAHDQRRLDEHVRSFGVDLVDAAGEARFVDPEVVGTADGRTWKAERIIIAAGGHARRLSIPGAELGLVYSDIRHLTAVPHRIAVIGGADTGCQLASILADFGCDVLMLEHAERINRRADEEISRALMDAFAKRGIQVTTRATAERLTSAPSGIELDYRAGDRSRSSLVDAVFFAIGWTGNLDGLNLNAAGVNTEAGFIPVNEWMQTNVPHIFAVGDINGWSMLAPSARHEGRIAAENALLGNQQAVAHEIVATGSFTDPEYGSVGLTEMQARARYDCVVAVVRYDEVCRVR